MLQPEVVPQFVHENPAFDERIPGCFAQRVEKNASQRHNEIVSGKLRKSRGPRHRQPAKGGTARRALTAIADKSVRSVGKAAMEVPKNAVAIDLLADGFGKKVKARAIL